MPASEKGKSWVAHWAIDNDDPKEAIYMWYQEEPTFTMSDEIFGGADDHLAGHTLTFYIQEFNKTFPGADPIEKARNANNTGYGSPWTAPVKVKFPDAKQAEATTTAKKPVKAKKKS